MNYNIEIDEIQESGRIKGCATLDELCHALELRFANKRKWEVAMGSTYVAVFDKSGPTVRTVFKAISPLC